MELRGECQESLYNTGRALHQIGLVSEAAYFYKKALQCPLDIDCTDQEKDEIFDLRREIAFNLCLIYRHSESPELALHYMHKYLTI
jgi:general transcription factor 3C polypeptide 3 (transcription factor C subunit 4)